mmetsp:Transcript_20989/g.53686  ORF Transcript_20989/g.53686 Transcript_20989/m.53686 type:complete len:327 (+) Transcript_20989:167-1147(+)
MMMMCVQTSHGSSSIAQFSPFTQGVYFTVQMHDERQVMTLVCPILQGDADFTALTFSLLAKLSTNGVTFFSYAKPSSRQRRRSDTGPFLGTLAYPRALAVKLSHSAAKHKLSPFANTSLSEDLDFVERALAHCHRMLPIAWKASVVYVRHVAVSNTWRPRDLDGRLQGDHTGRATEPPSFVDVALRAAYVAAEKEAATLGACRARARFEPRSLQLQRRQGIPPRFPYMPQHCCQGKHGVRARRPCSDSAAPDREDCGEENFCGAVKGICTSRCTCKGETSHGMTGTIACGVACCSYWHLFWQRNPQNCTATHRPRPLMNHYCNRGI